MKKLLVSLIVLMFAAAPVSAQNLVVDGGFEFGMTGDAYLVVNDGETMGAWDVTASPYGVLLCYDTINTPPRMFDMVMPEGTQFCHIGESAQDNTITQTISGFTVGAKYELSLAAMNYGDSYTLEFNLRVYNVTADTYDLDIVEDMGGSTGPAVRDPAILNYMPYTTHEFFASNTELELSIQNPGDAAWTIDDISINIAGTVVGTTVPTSLEVWENAAQGPTSGTFTVVLDETPIAGDTITVDVDPNSDGDGVDLTVDLTQLTFTDTTWNIPQTVTVSAIDDTWADGQTEVDLVGFALASALSDPNYDLAIIPSVEVTIYDDDSDAILVSKTSASIAEGGAGDSYTIKLATDPTDPVTVYVAAGMVPVSETDSNMVPDPFDCQLTVNGGGSATLVFTAKDAPQTVTIAAVDDSMVEADPHNIVISNIVSTDDAIYSAITADDVSVEIADNDARAWSFGDDVVLAVTNYSFEDPALGDGGVADFNEVTPVPGHEFWQIGQMQIINPTGGEWASMYKAGEQQAPDGEQVLSFGAYGGTEFAPGLCEYLIEPDPVSYTYEVSVGVPEPNDAGAYLTIYVSANDSDGSLLGRIVEPPPTYSLSGGDLVAGEWVDIKVCGVIEADSDFIGGGLSIGVEAQGVQMDNWRLTLGNHPCDGCLLDITEAEGDLNDDCKIDLADFAIMAGNYLDCNIYPDCISSW